MWRSLLILSLLAFPSFAQETPRLAVRRIPSAAEAHQVALADLQTLPVLDRPFIRYLWIRDGRVESAKALSLTLNLVSRSSILHRPPGIQQNGILLLQVDLRRFAPKEADLLDWLNIWEDFRFDPSFNTLLTPDVLQRLLRERAHFETILEWRGIRFLEKCRPYPRNGEVYDSRWTSTLRFPANHLDAKTVLTLENLTLSDAPVVESSYFLTRALTSVRGKGAFLDIWGGEYYRLNGIKTAKEVGRKAITDEDLLFDNLGIGVNAQKVFDLLESDQRGAILRSGVTGKKRRWDLLPAKSVRPGVAQSAVAVTHDIADEDVDQDADVFANLDNFKDAAREVIYVGANGLFRGVLFDGKGNLQEAAPDNVVRDSTIPSPFTNRLQAGMSCVRCHLGDGNDGWKPLQNDVPQLVRLGADIVEQEDDSGKRRTQQERIARLVGQYQGSPDKFLRRAREDQQEAFLRAMKPWKDLGDQTGIVKTSANEIALIFARYNYSMVGPETALGEMGYAVESKWWTDPSLDTFRNLVPSDLRSNVGGVLLEDYRAAALRANLPIDRPSWSLFQSFATVRARQTEQDVSDQRKWYR